MERIITESKLVVNGHRENCTFKNVSAEEYQNPNGQNLIGPDPGYISIGPPGSGADYECKRGATLEESDDLAAIINPLVAPDTCIYLLKGKYRTKGVINIENVSFFKIFGAGKDNTVIFTEEGKDGIKLTSSANHFKNGLYNFTLNHGDVSGSGTNVGNTNTVGIRMDSNKSCSFVDLNISWFDTGIKLEDDVFYSAFHRIEVQNSSSTSCFITYGVADRCNENSFFDCVFLGATAPGTAANGAPNVQVYIERGNNNKFIGCCFENWKTYGIQFDDDALCEANFFIGCRLESNGWIVGSGPAIKCGNASQRNYVIQPYIGGDDTATDTWIDFGTSTNWVEASNYRGSIIRKERSLLSAGDFVTYIRSGSGDAKSLLTLRDSYNASGSPDGTLKIDVYRPTGTALKIEQDSTREIYNITNEGEVNLKGFIDLGAPKASFNMSNISPQLDGASTLTGLNYIEFDNPVISGGGAITVVNTMAFNGSPGVHGCIDAGTTKTTPATVNAWLKINIAGTQYYMPAYTSKTT